MLLPGAYRPTLLYNLFLKTFLVAELGLESRQSIDEPVARRNGSVAIVNLDGMPDELGHRALMQE